MATLEDGEVRYGGPRPRKLTPETEATIRVAAARGATLRQLAAAHGVSHQTVARIVRGSGHRIGAPNESEHSGVMAAD